MRSDTTARRYQARRVLLGLALTGVLFAAGEITSSTAAEPIGPVEPAERERVVVVGEGETLWDLALPFAPAGHDPHEWLAVVADHNGIEVGDIHPGDAIRLPRS